MDDYAGQGQKNSGNTKRETGKIPETEKDIKILYFFYRNLFAFWRHLMFNGKKQQKTVAGSRISG